MVFCKLSPSNKRKELAVIILSIFSIIGISIFEAYLLFDPSLPLFNITAIIVCSLMNGYTLIYTIKVFIYTIRDQAVYVFHFGTGYSTTMYIPAMSEEYYNEYIKYLERRKRYDDIREVESKR